jgi:hypothetical protein
LQTPETADLGAAQDAAAVEEPSVVAEIEGAAGQRVSFLEIAPDTITVYQSGAIGTEPLRFDSESSGLADMYTQLAATIDPAVLAKLERADARAAELEAAMANVVPPDFEPPAEPLVEKASFTGFVGPTFPSEFRAAFCNAASVGFDGEYCRTDITSGGNGFPGDIADIRSVVFFAGGDSAVTHSELHYKCTHGEIFGGCLFNAGSWKTTTKQTLTQGMWGMYINNSKWVRYSASATAARFHMSVIWKLR